MKKILSGIVAGFALVLMGCASGAKVSSSPAEIEALDNLVSSRSFEITAQWARPMPSQALNSISNAGMLPNGSNASRVDINGNGSYLRVIGDVVKADLPFFGERQMSGGYDPQRTGIQFDGVPEDLQIQANSKTKGYTMRFSINNGTETFQVVAQLFPSRSSTFSIVSSHRAQIRYEGRLSEYVEEEE